MTDDNPDDHETDAALLAAFVERRDQRAFETLVRRYVDIVFSAARRQAARADVAEDVTQAVFILLARKAGSINRNKSLGAWLIQTTRYVAMAAARREALLKRREAKAAAMRSERLDQTDEAAAWFEIA